MTRTEASEYIKAHCNPDYPHGKTEWDTAINMAIQALSEPERNVGKWVYSNDFRKIETCSCCGEPWGHIATWFNFCPTCGMKMERQSQKECNKNER